MDILSCVRGSVTPGSRPFTIRRQGPSFTETNDPELPEGKRAQQNRRSSSLQRHLDTGRVSTYPVYTMNVTIALSDELVARVREIAQNQGTTLNELVRRQLELVAGRQTGEALADEMRKLWAQSVGHSGGKRIRRSDAYDSRRS